MKKNIIVTILLSLAIANSSAQEDIDITTLANDESKISEAETQSGWNTTSTRQHNVVTNSFFSNWFVSAGLVGTAFYADYEHDGISKSPFKSLRNSFGMSLSVGKWFTPGLGLRTKLNGFWGKENFLAFESSSYKFLALHEQILFNLNNMFYGYDSSRLYSFIPYIGFGLNRNISHNLNALGFSIGLLNSFRVSKRISLNVDINFNRQNRTLAAQLSPYKSYNCEVSITYNIGNSKWEKTPDVEAIHEMYQMEIDAINAQLQDEQQENENLRNQLNTSE
ncbi:MAG: hypothetical protein ACI3Y0_12415 [Prevotella sp.]